MKSIRLSLLVEFGIEFGPIRQEGQALMLAGLLTALPSPTGNPDVQVFVWLNLSFPPPLRPNEPWRPDPFGPLFRRNPKIKLNEDPQFYELTRIGGQPAENFQIDASWGSERFQSEKLEQLSLPLDKTTYKPHELFAHASPSLTLTLHT